MLTFRRISPMNNLSFDADKHEYRLDGVIIPGFSRIAKDMGLVDYSHVDPETLDYKGQVGQAVHKAIFLHNDGTLDMDSLAEPVTGYFKSWLMFRDLYKPTILTEHSEVPICSCKWRYGITPDIVAEIQGIITVIEIKCVSQITKITALQTVAQKTALEETYKIKIQERAALQLIPNCMPKLTIYVKMSDATAWLSFVNGWHWKKESGLWKN